MSRGGFDPDILRYYAEERNEDLRLRSGLREVELIRTKEIVRRFLPEGALRILDVGGGSGVHAEWLLDEGHNVHLIDPVPRHVDQATERLDSTGRFTAETGDARQLTQPDASFDAVLLLGPLYHLTDRADRLLAWREARRVTRPGGLIFAVGISRFANMLVGLTRGLLFDEQFQQLTRDTLAGGQHRNPEGRDFFTTAFFHHPSELEAEAVEAGWSVLAVLGVEGGTSLLPQLEEHWNDPEGRAAILEAARAVETEPTLLGLGPHLMLVGERTD